MTAEHPSEEQRKAIVRQLAVETNNAVWGLLAKRARSDEDGRNMLDNAHTSFALWRKVGDPQHWQRGAWLVSRVHAELGHGALATTYARACRTLTEQHPDALADFDFAYALEAEARAAAVSGDLNTADRLRAKAETTARGIANSGDRKQVEADLADGNWGQLKRER